MIGLIRYLKGYVRIRIWGYGPERFMNLCTNHHIVLWDIKKEESACYTMFISLSDFWRIAPIGKKTKTRAAVLERYGLPFFLRKMKTRVVFGMGIPCCIIFWLIMSQFIWAIDFEGNLSISDDVLRDFLITEGVDYGTAKKELNLEELESKVRETFPIVTWTSVQLKGSHFTLCVKENDLRTEEEDSPALLDGADLKATNTGVVYSILTRKGVPLVKAGDSVEAGDILVSGSVPVMNDDGTVKNYQYTVADADILIQCTEEVQIEQKLNYQYKNYTGKEQKIRFFTLSGKRYLLNPFQKNFLKYDEVVEEDQFCLFGQIDLPLYTGKIIRREYLSVDAVYDTDQAKELLLQKLSKIITTLEEKGVQIIEKDVKIEKKSNALVLKGNFIVLKEAVTAASLIKEELPVEESEEASLD